MPRPTIKVPAGYKLPKMGPKPSGVGDAFYINVQKITLKDLRGNVIAKEITRKEALQIIRARFEEGLCG